MGIHFGNSLSWFGLYWWAALMFTVCSLLYMEPPGRQERLARLSDWFFSLLIGLFGWIVWPLIAWALWRYRRRHRSAG